MQAVWCVRVCGVCKPCVCGVLCVCVCVCVSVCCGLVLGFVCGVCGEGVSVVCACV